MRATDGVQPSGFSVFTIFGLSQGSVLRTWSHDGVLVSTAQIAPDDPRSIAPSPSSGAQSLSHFFGGPRRFADGSGADPGDLHLPALSQALAVAFTGSAARARRGLPPVPATASASCGRHR